MKYLLKMAQRLKNQTFFYFYLSDFSDVYPKNFSTAPGFPARSATGMPAMLNDTLAVLFSLRFSELALAARQRVVAAVLP